MTIDTSALTTGLTDFLNSVFTYVPLGLTIIGVPAAIGIGIAFGGRLIGYVKTALGGK